MTIFMHDSVVLIFVSHFSLLLFSLFFLFFVFFFFFFFFQWNSRTEKNVNVLLQFENENMSHVNYVFSNGLNLNMWIDAGSNNVAQYQRYDTLLILFGSW